MECNTLWMVCDYVFDGRLSCFCFGVAFFDHFHVLSRHQMGGIFGIQESSESQPGTRSRYLCNDGRSDQTAIDISGFEYELHSLCGSCR